MFVPCRLRLHVCGGFGTQKALNLLNLGHRQTSYETVVLFMWVFMSHHEHEYSFFLFL